MYEIDDSWDGFQWINADDADRSIFSFYRKDKSGKQGLLFVINMTPVERPDYMVGVPRSGRYTLIFNENGKVKNLSGKNIYRAKKGECDHQPWHIPHPLSGYGLAVFRFHP